MPHKDRETRLAYLRAWKLKHRPAPAPEPQSRGDLPPLGRIVFSEGGDQVQCHVCGAWLGSLNTHLTTHGLTAATYKAEFGLARGASLWPPALKAQQRAAALARGQGEIGRDNLPPAQPRQVGLETRLSSRVESSEARSGINMRAGGKPRRSAP